MTKHWLLECSVGGRVYRWSDEALTVTSNSGTVLDFHCLGELAELVVSVGEGPITVAVDLPPETPDGVYWASIVQGGVDIAAGTASLSRWTEGTVYELRKQVCSGRITNPEYGGPQDPLSISIERAPWDETVTIPPIAQRFTESTWPVTTPGPVADPSVRDISYPWVFGFPGREGNGLLWGTMTFEVPATPAYLGEVSSGNGWRANKLIIAGHTVAATEVRVTDVSGGYGRIDAVNDRLSETLPVLSMVDLLGQTVSYVNLTAADVISARAGNEYWISWWSTTGGGMYDSTRTAAMRGLGDITEFVLRYAGIPINRGKQAAAKARLNTILVDCAITRPVRPQDWIEQTFFDSLPMLRRESVEGIWYELINHEPTVGDVVGHLVAQTYSSSDADGVPVVRDGRVKYSDVGKVENEISLRYCPRHGGEFCKHLTYTGAADPDTDAFERGSWILAISQTRYGIRPKTIDVPYIADAASANRIGSIRSAAYGLPKRMINVVADGDFECEPNSIVYYSDVDLGIYKQFARVASTSLGLKGDSFALELFDSPVHRRPNPTAVPTSAPLFGQLAFANSGLVLYADGTGYSGTAAAVTAITDQTGNGNGFAVLSGTDPTWVQHDSRFNGRPGFLFNGGYLATATTPTFGDFTVLVVYCDALTATNEEIIIDHQYNTGWWIGRNSTNPGIYTAGVLEGSAPYGSLVTLADATVHSIAMSRSGTDKQIYADGLAYVAATVSGSTTTAATIRIGGGGSGGLGSTMHVALVMVWTRAITSAEHAAIYGVIKPHFGLP